MNERPYILFTIADATYAVTAEQVQQVEMTDTITAVPNAPPFVSGIVYLRGQVIPVVSVRRRFHMEDVPSDARSRLIITNLDGRLVGMLVDAARDFVRLDMEKLAPLPEDLRGPGREYLAGVLTPQPGRIILVVDLHQLLNPEEQQALNRLPAEEK